MILTGAARQTDGAIRTKVLVIRESTRLRPRNPYGGVVNTPNPASAIPLMGVSTKPLI